MKAVKNAPEEVKQAIYEYEKARSRLHELGIGC